MRISLVIPTRNAGPQLKKLWETLRRQTLRPDEILVVDSQSTDGTAQVAARLPGVNLVRIRQEDFDHGGTRDMALRASEGDIVLFMTQDALPVNECLIEELVEPFADPRIAAAGGRQIAYPEARPFEKAIRAYNYPACSRVWNESDIPARGIRAFMISDVCSAYRRDAYLEVGGFDHPLKTNEDMLMAQKLLEAGYALAYCAEAAVYHSHRLTLSQEYRRNYAIGQVLEQYDGRFGQIRETGEGAKLVNAVLRRLIQEGQYGECFAFAASCGARFLGNRMGRQSVKRAEKA